MLSEYTAAEEAGGGSSAPVTEGGSKRHRRSRTRTISNSSVDSDVSRDSKIRQSSGETTSGMCIRSDLNVKCYLDSTFPKTTICHLIQSKPCDTTIQIPNKECL